MTNTDDYHRQMQALRAERDMSEVRAEIDDIRAHTARIRHALRELPGLRKEFHEGMNREQDLREVLQEIIGSATHIADTLGVEL